MTCLLQDTEVGEENQADDLSVLRTETWIVLDTSRPATVASFVSTLDSTESHLTQSAL